MSVLSLEEANHLRAAVNAARGARGLSPTDLDDNPDPVDVVDSGTGLSRAGGRRRHRLLFQLDTSELLLAGLVRTRLAPVLILAALPFQFMQQVEPDPNRLVGRVMGIVEGIQLPEGAQAVGLGFLLLVGVGLAASVLSVVTTALLFNGFELRLVDKDLRRRHGLFTLRASTLPRHRIQVLRLDESPLRRLAGRLSILADTAGSPVQGREVSGRDALVPLATPARAAALLPELLPGLRGLPDEWTKVSPLAVRRAVIRGLFPLAGAVAAAVYALQGVGWLALLALPLLWWLARKRYDNLGYAVVDDHFMLRRGWLGRSTHIVPLHKIQGVYLRANPFDRRLGLVTILVDTAGQSLGNAVSLRDVPREQAEALSARLGRAAARTGFRW